MNARWCHPINVLAWIIFMFKKPHIPRKEQILLEREQAVSHNETRLNNWLKVKKILSMEYRTDFPTGDILIRVKRETQIHSESIGKGIEHQHCEIREIKDAAQN